MRCQGKEKRYEKLCGPDYLESGRDPFFFFVFNLTAQKDKATIATSLKISVELPNSGTVGLWEDSDVVGLMEAVSVGLGDGCIR